jgi:hypothetical protein
MSSRNRENDATIKRLQRVSDVLKQEMREIPFLPKDITDTLNGTISYVKRRCAALGPVEEASDSPE